MPATFNLQINLSCASTLKIPKTIIINNLIKYLKKRKTQNLRFTSITIRQIHISNNCVSKIN